jgi:hypothetical protein
MQMNLFNVVRSPAARLCGVDRENRDPGNAGIEYSVTTQENLWDVWEDKSVSHTSLKGAR